MYGFDSRVRFSECDAQLTLSVRGMMNYFQDCSTFQSEDIGNGIEVLHEKNQAWVTSSWQVVIDRLPKLGEKIHIGTIPYGIKGVIGYRNYIMTDDNGKRLIAANSIWTYLNLGSGLPERIPKDVANSYAVEEKLDMNYAPRKISFPENGVSVAADSIIIGKSSIDSNNHVNNEQYIEMALYSLPDNIQKKLHIRQIRAEYRRQCFLGDEVTPVIIENEADDGSMIYDISLNSVDGAVYCIVEIRTEVACNER